MNLLQLNIRILKNNADKVLDGIRDLSLREELAEQNHSMETLDTSQPQSVVFVRGHERIGKDLKEAILECQQRSNKVGII